MQHTAVSKGTSLIRLQKGEELIETLINFSNEAEFGFAEFSGLGAISDPTLAFYHLDDKKYDQKLFSGHFELVNITGNISALDKKKIIHCHSTLSNEKFGVIGGHLQSAYCAATLEVVMKVYTPKIKREFDEEIGLNLLALGDDNASD